MGIETGEPGIEMGKGAPTEPGIGRRDTVKEADGIGEAHDGRLHIHVHQELPYLLLLDRRQ